MIKFHATHRNSFILPVKPSSRKPITHVIKKPHCDKHEKYNMHAIVLPSGFLTKHGLKSNDCIVVSFDNGNQLQCAMVSQGDNRGITVGRNFLEKQHACLDA